jgi:hypothetical protein
MNRNAHRRFCGLVILLALAGCTSWTPMPTPTSVPTATPRATPGPSATPAPRLTLTIKGSECTLNGPTTLPYGQFEITLVIDEPEVSETGYALVALDEGRTIADLEAWQSADQPEWADRLAGEHQMEAGTSSRNIDLVPMAAMQGRGAFYIVCIHTDPQTHVREKIGALGPIEVER